MVAMIRFYIPLVLFFLIRAHSGDATSNITVSQPLLQNQTLVSNNQLFELGFFTLKGSANQYVGIWYKDTPTAKVVWVLNRDAPIASTDRFASVTVGNDGNLKLLDGQQKVVWSTSVSVQSNYRVATLFETGNFVLHDENSTELWASFDHPTDTLLPRMKIGINTKTRVKQYLVSWKSDNDPSSGKFSMGVTPETPPQIFTWNGSTAYWRSGQWNKLKFIGVPLMNKPVNEGDYSMDQDPQRGTTYYSINTDIRFHDFISPTGSLIRMLLLYGNWVKIWASTDDKCSVYGTCGPFGVCNMTRSPICSCLYGFKPRSEQEWNRGNWTGGCVRVAKLNCQGNVTTSVSTTNKKDVFVKLSQMKVPDSADIVSVIRDVQGCESRCQNNCSCLAYSYITNIGCMVWSEVLKDVNEFSGAGYDLFLRLANKTADRGSANSLAFRAGGSTKRKLVISISTISCMLFFGAAIFSMFKYRANRKDQLRSRNAWKEQLTQDDASELTFFSLHSLLLATNHFDISNKLGQGGFGPVYKGQMNDGKEVAVKRLSSSSGQGMQEFKNEIILISKLRHRNLVRLLGCCIEGEEKILVYEYMTNKSLDSFLFDAKKRTELDWNMRFHIINGVARGLLYLHRDSCLRVTVIHRDLKVSNILLDEMMNPKISDFGLARMFEGSQVVVDTRKVVGTLGYMSPEYAMAGIFSEKSDVYSFGVLVLEIIIGKRNTAIFFREEHHNLLSYAWQLWSEGSGLDLIDEALVSTCPWLEVMRYVQVGLLCVQDQAKDRPNMSSVVQMLSSESDLPQPRQPTFTFQREMAQMQSQGERNMSANSITNSMVEGR